MDSREDFRELKELKSFEGNRSEETWLRRTFGPMNQGSIRGSVFTLTSTAMGAGYLAIPRVLEYTGLLLGLTLIVLCGIVMYLSLMTVMRCIFKHKIFYYPEVTEKELGRRWAVTLEAAIILNGLGVMIGYFIIVGILAPDILNSINVHGNALLERDLTLVFMAFIVVLPLGLMRKIGALRFKALFNVVNLSFIAILIFIEFPFYAQNNDYSEIRYVYADINIFSGFSLPIFAYLSHQNISKIQSELVRCDERRMSKVITRSVSIQCSLFVFLSFFAYMSLLNNLPELIIMRRPPSQITNDWAMVLARSLLCLTLMIAIPINLMPTRTSIIKIVFKKEGEQVTQRLHVIVTVACVVSTLTVALFFPQINIVFNFLGGFCGSIMALIVPAMIHVKMSGLPASAKSNAIVLGVAGLMSAIGITSVVVSTLVTYS